MTFMELNAAEVPVRGRRDGGSQSGILRARVLLISTYDLGHQPFGLASPATWLTDAGFEVTSLDLSRRQLSSVDVSPAHVVAFYVPMHTATRLAITVLEQVRELNPSARICFYGLYGQANASHLLALGADAVISGEFESALADYVTTVTGATHGTPGPVARTPGIALSPLDKLSFRVPDRTGLPPLAEYAHLAAGGRRQIAGYTEASRGCRHKCRHCPVVPVYQGRLRIVQADVVLRDIDQQVSAGAEHITFGDPDFFNAPAHAVRLVEALHERYPDVSYDVTIKVEHLLRNGDLLAVLAATGCKFVTTAAESMDDRVLAYLDKGHTRADFIAAVGRCRAAGVVVNPTFVAFHPWSTRESALDTFAVLEELELAESVAPIQLTTRLLIPEGSLLLDLPELTSLLGPFDRTRLVYPWTSPDPAMDELHAASERLVARSGRENWSRSETFDGLYRLAGGSPRTASARAVRCVPHLSEPWFCCSEPVGELLGGWSTATSTT